MEKLSTLYASALFDLAVEHGYINDLRGQVLLLLDALGGVESRHVLAHPHIPASEKQELFRKAFAGHIHDDLLSFLCLVAEKNREAFLLPALKALLDKINYYNGIVTAKVFSAVEYDEAQKKKLRELLSKKLDKNVKLSLKIDPSVIGGPYIFVDGYYLDWTVKKRLHNLTAYMKEVYSR